MTTLSRFNTELQEFIRIHPEDWENRLTSDPYNLHVKHDPIAPFILFKYDQIRSDMSQQICREARGIILYKEDWRVVCRAFDKFFNIQEQFAAPIDWDTARIQEKIDGSILKLWNNPYFNEWHLSTNGSINAYETDVMFPTDDVKTFGAMFNYALGDWFVKNHESLVPTMTYIFEVVGPQNRIVVPYPLIDAYHIGTRNNETGQEYDVDIGVKKPHLYNFEDKESILAMAKELDYKNEGFVVVDDFWNRVKIKSEEYVRVHRLRGETLPTPKRILDIVRNNGSDDFLSYFPEYRDSFEKTSQKYAQLLKDVRSDLEEYVNSGWDKETDRKKFALDFAKKCRVPDVVFQVKDGKLTSDENSITGYFQQMPIDKLIKLVKIED